MLLSPTEQAAITWSVTVTPLFSMTSLICDASEYMDVVLLSVIEHPQTSSKHSVTESAVKERFWERREEMWDDVIGYREYGQTERGVKSVKLAAQNYAVYTATYVTANYTVYTATYVLRKCENKLFITIRFITIILLQLYYYNYVTKIR